MFKCSVKVDEKLQKELNEKTWIFSLISLIVGAIGLGSYVVIGVFFDSIFLEMLLWVFAFAFGYGMILIITIRKTNKKSIERNFVDNIELNEEYLTESITRNGEAVSTNKHYYKDLVKIKETENYLFLYVNKASAVPVIKNAFTPEELSTIKLWINSAKIKK